MCATLEKQVGSYTKATTTFHHKRLQKLCRNGKLFEYVLARITETIKPIYNLPGKGDHSFGEKNNKILSIKSNAYW